VPVLVIQHELGVSLGRFGPWLADAGVHVEIVQAAAGIPDSLAGHQGLVVLGGTMAAWADQEAPWLPRVRELLRCAVEAAVPTLGLCLGGQLLALALGGRVERGPAGWEVGVSLVVPTAEAGADPLASYVPTDGLPAAQWHSDAVTTLPHEATVLLTGSPYPHQMFRVGNSAWGTQFHPEVTVSEFCGWGEVAPPEGIDVPAAYARVRSEQDALAAAWRPMAMAFARVVQGTDSPPRDGESSLTR
jgi:GMP synthase (glutamine-hydrolysing)